MSARDWSTIGAGPSLPRWIRWAIPPLLIPLAAVAWIATHWDRIPLRYATHFGADGRPDGWTTRTSLHVYGVPIFAEGLAGLLVALVVCTWYGSRRPAAASPMEKIPLAVAYLLSVVFTAVGLAPVAQVPVWPLAAASPLLALAMIVYAVRAQGQPDDAGAAAPDPQEPALFVRARVGYSYTLNMANRWSYAFVIGLFGGIALLTGFLIWSQR
jgi:uncharacterized membrane protein